MSFTVCFTHYKLLQVAPWAKLKALTGQTGSWERHKGHPLAWDSLCLHTVITTSFKPLPWQTAWLINRLLLLSFHKSVDLICEASGHWNEQWLQPWGIHDLECDTHRVQWYKRNSELRSEIWPPSKPSTQKECGLCICGWDESVKTSETIRQASPWHLGRWANNAYSVALRWSDYVADNVDVQCVVLSVQCWTANMCIYSIQAIMTPGDWSIIQLSWLCAEVHDKHAQCFDRVIPQPFTE